MMGCCPCVLGKICEQRGCDSKYPAANILVCLGKEDTLLPTPKLNAAKPAAQVNSLFVGDYILLMGGHRLPP